MSDKDKAEKLELECYYLVRRTKDMAKTLHDLSRKNPSFLAPAPQQLFYTLTLL